MPPRAEKGKRKRAGRETSAGREKTAGNVKQPPGTAGKRRLRKTQAFRQEKPRPMRRGKYGAGAFSEGFTVGRRGNRRGCGKRITHSAGAKVCVGELIEKRSFGVMQYTFDGKSAGVFRI